MKPMDTRDRLYLIQFSHTWPGVFLAAMFSPLAVHWRWWLIPAAVGWALLAWGVVRSHLLLMRELRESEKRATKGGDANDERRD